MNTQTCVPRFTDRCKRRAHRSVFRPPRRYPRLVTFCAYLTSRLHCAIQISESAPLSYDARTYRFRLLPTVLLAWWCRASLAFDSRGCDGTPPSCRLSSLLLSDAPNLFVLSNRHVRTMLYAPWLDTDIHSSPSAQAWGTQALALGGKTAKANHATP